MCLIESIDHVQSEIWSVSTIDADAVAEMRIAQDFLTVGNGQ